MPCPSVAMNAQPPLGAVTTPKGLPPVERNTGRTPGSRGWAATAVEHTGAATVRCGDVRAEPEPHPVTAAPSATVTHVSLSPAHMWRTLPLLVKRQPRAGTNTPSAPRASRQAPANRG